MEELFQLLLLDVCLYYRGNPTHQRHATSFYFYLKEIVDGRVKRGQQVRKATPVGSQQTILLSPTQQIKCHCLKFYTKQLTESSQCINKSIDCVYSIYTTGTLTGKIHPIAPENVVDAVNIVIPF